MRALCRGAAAGAASGARVLFGEWTAGAVGKGKTNDGKDDELKDGFHG